jgi:acyl-CoA-binding protein
MLMRLLALFALSTVAFAATPNPAETLRQTALFHAALIAAKDKSGKALDDEERLAFYGLFKASQEGPCTVAEPSMLLDLVGWMKWNAWNSLGQITKEEAMARYVALMDEKKPGWRK